MANWGAGSVTTVSTASLHGARSVPKGVLVLGGTTAPLDSTQQSVGGLSVGVAHSTFVGVGRLYHPFSTGTSAGVLSHASTDPAVLGAAGGGFQSESVTQLTTDTLSIANPIGNFHYLVVAGDDASGAASGVVSAPVSSVAGTTQASTGVGFTPNAAVVVGQSSASSVGNLSFGVACADTAGAISQWSIDLVGRVASSAHVHRSASTGSVLKLHTTATTAHDVSVTSFRSDGLEMTVNVSDTARPANRSILQLGVPRARAGKATITTNGVGAGMTGVSVSGLGPVQAVIVASVGSSLQTLQADNRHSVGVGITNGVQRSVAGFVKNAAVTAADYQSYISSTRVVTFLDTAGVVSQGLFACTDDGFTVTFNNTNANGWDLYYAAFSNIVQDIEAHMFSSVLLGAGLSLTQRLEAAIASSFTLLAYGEPDFFPGEGKSHSALRIETEIKQKSNYGDASFLIAQENSSSPDLSKTLNVTTAKTRIGVAEFGNAAILRVLPPSTNSVPLRLAGSRQTDGFPISSNGMSVFALGDRTGTDVFLYTTSTGTTIEGVRVLLG